MSDTSRAVLYSCANSGHESPFSHEAGKEYAALDLSFDISNHDHILFCDRPASCTYVLGTINLDRIPGTTSRQTDSWWCTWLTIRKAQPSRPSASTSRCLMRSTPRSRFPCSRSRALSTRRWSTGYRGKHGAETRKYRLLLFKGELLSCCPIMHSWLQD